jgi:hypothetical protein
MRATASTLLLLSALACAASTTPSWAKGNTLADVPGTVISYEPSPSLIRWAFGHGEFVGSPTLARLPNGHYVAAHDLFGRGGGETEPGKGITKVFRSTDRGVSWSQVSRVEGAFWSTLFEHQGALYLWGFTKASGDLVVRRSTDEGQTWTDPRDATRGLLRQGRYGGTPNPPVVHAGRLWIAQGTRVFSAPVGADLLQASAWAQSRAPRSDPSYMGGRFTFWSEGQVVASPNTGVVVLPKIKNRSATALLRYSAPRAAPTFDPAQDFATLPGAEKKFGARYDPVSGKFYVLSNPVLARHAPKPGKTSALRRWRCAHDAALVRNAAALYASTDLRTWELQQVFLYSPDVNRVAFQYLNFLIEGQDLIVVSRTAYNVGKRNTPRSHDSNLLTFHRIPNFRVRPANPYPPALQSGGAGIVSSVP